jgi:hypothetical protein
MHISNIVGIMFFLLQIFCFFIVVYADFQRTYQFDDSVISVASAHRRKREDLFQNTTLVKIVDELGNTSIVGTLCVKPEEDDDEVILTFKHINYMEISPVGLYIGFYVNNTYIGNVTSYDITPNETMTSSSIIYGESGQIGGNITLPEGNYPFDITVQTDENGIELFGIDVNATRQNSTADIFCGEGFYDLAVRRIIFYR